MTTFAKNKIYILENFAELGIGKDVIKGLAELGIIIPTAIQQQAIPILLNGDTDFVGRAQTGTGKTAAYSLPVLERIDPGFDKPQALILSPTRELCQQVAKQLFKFTKYTSKIFTEAVYGGEKIDVQIAKLKRPTQIIVATPGRLLDLQRRKAVDLRYVKVLVLDEADEMLSMGFKKELDEILVSLKEVKSKWLFSATMPHGINQIVNEHLSQGAQRINVGKDSVVNVNIDHKFLLCEDVDKLAILLDFLKSKGKQRGVIFCRTKASTAKLAKQLQAKNISAEAIQGDMLQKDRDKVMRAFKNESLRLLVATDLAARGIDVQDLAFVVHYQFPDQQEYYTHRSGRTARAGKDGVSLALVTSRELKTLRNYEKALGISFAQIRKIS